MILKVFKGKAKYVIQKLMQRLVGKMTKHGNGYLSLLSKGYKPLDDSIETYFVTDSGDKIPVYQNYRYSIKKGWRYVRALDILDRFDKSSLLNRKEQSKLRDFVSNRTITAPIKEINTVAGSIFEKHANRFLELDTVRQRYVLKPSSKEINKAVQDQKTHHQLLFHKLQSFGADCRLEDRKLLEIGYISGGYSLFGFDKLGLEVFGIDNCYDGLEENLALLPNYIRTVTGQQVEFRYDDITRQTDFGSKTFDYIYSSSVLEHIKDLRGAFREMKRILRNDGLLIHAYNPFFTANGGHALGILDSPWGHVLLSSREYDRYLKQLRPHEYDLGADWVQNALNRVTISQMQGYLVEAGFDIVMWQQNACPKYQSDQLTSRIIQGAFDQYDEISLADLISQTIFFVARSQT